MTSAAPVVATAIGLAGAVRADSASEGIGTVTAKDLVARTIAIDSRVFRVNERTIIVDLGGRRIGLAQVAASGPLVYEYEAVETGGGLVLMRLQASEMPR